jgi:putative transposase
MHAEKSNFTVSRMARLLEVSRSGFYAWLQREPSKRALRTERVEAKIAWFHGASDEVSGSPRILADLREDGETISRKTVANAMRKLGLRGICPRRWRTTTPA